MNADHGQEPPSSPSADPADTWILIDDTEEAEPPAADPGDFWTQSTTWGAPSAGGPDESAKATEPQEPPAGPGPGPQSQDRGQGEERGPGRQQGQKQEQGQEQGQGWDSFASAGTWNGMRASAPGAPGGWGAPQYDSGQPKGAGQTHDAGQSRPEEPAQDPWFAEDDLVGDFADDDAPASGSVATLTDRLPSLSLSFGPGFVTFVVICGSVLLTISSIIWHPRVP
ncbi:hypothetical protein ACRYCC_13155 [Actinomadura scrupuli]|uniref:hypothetical protein n=1 Tax=Actinomadura scrupuli TaxID=559629 RepID=UPI003D987136